MKKLRYYLAVIVLAATLSGPALLQGTGALANAASSHHVTASSVAGKSSRSVAIRRFGPCPVLGIDC